MVEGGIRIDEGVILRFIFMLMLEGVSICVIMWLDKVVKGVGFLMKEVRCFLVLKIKIKFVFCSLNILGLIVLFVVLLFKRRNSLVFVSCL